MANLHAMRTRLSGYAALTRSRSRGCAPLMPPELMALLGLVPGQRSIGDTVLCSVLRSSGDGPARHALVEAA